MAALQGFFLTFIEVKSPLDMEEKLFKIKTLSGDRLTIESVPQSFPSQVWFWTDMTKIPLQFLSKENKSKLKKEEAQDA